jgi:uncharacterized RDD family membrane protein YckC
MNAPGGLAERGARLLAASIDQLVLLVLTVPMLLGAIPTQAELAPLERDPELSGIGQLAGQIVSDMFTGIGFKITVLALLAWAVVMAWLVATRSQSIGKYMVGIKVVRTDGSPASFARIFLLRNVVSFLPSFLPYVGWLYLFFIDPLLIYQESRRCIHDLIADTIVIRCVSKPQGST